LGGKGSQREGSLIKRATKRRAGLGILDFWSAIVRGGEGLLFSRNKGGEKYSKATRAVLNVREGKPRDATRSGKGEGIVISLREGWL